MLQPAEIVRATAVETHTSLSQAILRRRPLLAGRSCRCAEGLAHSLLLRYREERGNHGHEGQFCMGGRGGAVQDWEAVLRRDACKSSAALRISCHNCSLPAPVLAEKGTMRAPAYRSSKLRRLL